MYIKPKGERNMYNEMRMQKSYEMYDWSNKAIKALKEEAIEAINSSKNTKEISAKIQEYAEKFNQLEIKIKEGYEKI